MLTADRWSQVIKVTGLLNNSENQILFFIHSVYDVFQSL